MKQYFKILNECVKNKFYFRKIIEQTLLIDLKFSFSIILPKKGLEKDLCKILESLRLILKD